MPYGKFVREAATGTSIVEWIDAIIVVWIGPSSGSKVASWWIGRWRVDQQAIVMVLCISSHFIALLYVECQCSETCVAIGCRQTSQSHGADSALYPELLRFDGVDTVRHAVCEGSCFQLRVGASLNFIAKCSGTCAAKGWKVLQSSLARLHRSSTMGHLEHLQSCCSFHGQRTVFTSEWTTCCQ